MYHVRDLLAHSIYGKEGFLNSITLVFKSEVVCTYYITTCVQFSLGKVTASTTVMLRG